MRVYTVAEAAEILRTHPHVVYRLIKKGRIRAFRLGLAIRISDAELRRVMGLGQNELGPTGTGR